MPEGLYYGGADLGELADYSVLTVLRKAREQLSLVYLHEFPLGTPYTEVIGLLARADRTFRFQGCTWARRGLGSRCWRS